MFNKKLIKIIIYIQAFFIIHIASFIKRKFMTNYITIQNKFIKVQIIICVSIKKI